MEVLNENRLRERLKQLGKQLNVCRACEDLQSARSVDRRSAAVHKAWTLTPLCSPGGGGGQPALLADENIATATGCSQSVSAIPTELQYGRCTVTRGACGPGDDALYDRRSVTSRIMGFAACDVKLPRARSAGWYQLALQRRGHSGIAAPFLQAVSICAGARLACVQVAGGMSRCSLVDVLMLAVACMSPSQPRE